MTDRYEIADPNDPNTLRVPFMFVPHGCEPTPEWLRDHPGAIRIPAVMVPRDPQPGESGTQWNVQLDLPNRRDPTAAPNDGAGSWLIDRHGNPEPSGASSAPMPPHADVPPGTRAPGDGAALEMPWGGGSDPVAAWLTMKAIFGDPAGAAGTIVAVADVTTMSGTPGASANANPALGAAGPSAADIREDARLPSHRPGTTGQRGPTTPVLLVDDQGKPVLTSEEKPILFPAGLDPHFFVRKGLEDKKIMDELARNGGASGPSVALGYMLGELSNFLWWRRWNAQRLGGSYHDEYVDYASIAIGLYAAAAGIPRDSILGAQNLAAAAGSRFRPDKEPDKTYTHLLPANVENTGIGYRLYESGGIKAIPTP